MQMYFRLFNAHHSVLEDSTKRRQEDNLMNPGSK